MDKKITRRVVLGIAIGGLVAGPFAIRFYRNKRGHNIVSEDRYAEVDFLPDFATSEASKDNLKEAFDVFMSERKRWLQFRGISAQIKIDSHYTAQGSNAQDIKLADAGYLDMIFTEISPKSEDVFFPYKYDLAYSQPKGKNIWTYEFDRNSNEAKFSGKKIEAANPKMISEILANQFEFFSDMTNVNVQNALSLWNVEVDSNDPRSFSFASNGELTSDGFSLPKIVFRNGHLSEFHSKSKQGRPVSVSSYEEYVDCGGFFAPSKYTFLFEGGESNDNRVKILISLNLSDIVIHHA